MAPLRLIPALGNPIEISQDHAPIGRDNSAVVRLTDVSVSRKHARIERRGFDWVLVDLGSANGSFVDGVQVEGEIALHNGQEIRFGDMTYRVEMAGASRPEAAIDEEDEPLPTVFHFKAPPPPAIAPAVVRPVAAPPPPPPSLDTLIDAQAPALEPPPAIETTADEPTATLAAVTATMSAAPPPPGAPQAPALPAPPGAPAPGVHAAQAPRPASQSIRKPIPTGAVSTRKARGPVFLAVMGSLGCLAVVAVVAALLGGTLYFDTKRVLETVGAQLTDIRKGDLAKAYSRLHDDYRTRITLEDFERFASAHPGLRNNVDALFWPPGGSFRVEGNHAYVNGVLVAVSGVREQAAYELLKKGDAWKITSIRIEGKEPEPLPVAPPPSTQPQEEPTPAPQEPANPSPAP